MKCFKAGIEFDLRKSQYPYTHTHTHTHIYIYIYIYREREREGRMKEVGRGGV